MIEKWGLCFAREGGSPEQHRKAMAGSSQSISWAWAYQPSRHFPCPRPSGWSPPFIEEMLHLAIMAVKGKQMNRGPAPFLWPRWSGSPAGRSGPHPHSSSIALMGMSR